MDLKEKIKAVRTKTGLDQDEFAEEIGVSFSLYSKVEGGHKAASPALLKAIKDRYGISDNYFDGSEDLIITTPEKGKKSDNDSGLIRKMYDALMKQLEDKTRDVERWKADAADWKKVAMHHMGKHNTLAKAA